MNLPQLLYEHVVISVITLPICIKLITDYNMTRAFRSQWHGILYYTVQPVETVLCTTSTLYNIGLDGAHSTTV